MIRSGEAAAAQAAGRHIEIAAVFLNHDVGGCFGRAHQGMRALIDGEVLWNAVLERRIVILKARSQLAHRNAIGPVAIDFVGRHVDEWRFGTGPAGGFQKVQRPQRIDFEIQKWNRGGAVMGRLRGGVDDQVRTYFAQQGEHAVAVADIERRVVIAGNVLTQAIQNPTGVALGTEENRAMIVVDSVNLESLTSEESGNFRANEPAGTGDHYLRHLANNAPISTFLPRLPSGAGELAIHKCAW